MTVIPAAEMVIPRYRAEAGGGYLSQIKTSGFSAHQGEEVPIKIKDRNFLLSFITMAMIHRALTRPADI
jgi:hypothetical protein